jgi:hypothetical protein
MGLDVSLYKCPKNIRGIEEQKEDEYGTHAEEIWNKHLEGRHYQDMSQEEKDAMDAETTELAKGLGLNDDGQSPARECINIDSNLYPEHLFKIGYLRSSYNGSGLNSVLRELEIPDLYGIFEVGDGYYNDIDWQAALERVNESLEKFQLFLISEESKYQVMDCNFFHTEDAEVETKKDTLEKFLGHAQAQTLSKSFSHRDGHFFLDGINVKAVRFLPKGGRLGQPTVHLVVESKESSYTWYLQALEITKEMIEYVIETGTPEDYFLGWSG